MDFIDTMLSITQLKIKYLIEIGLFIAAYLVMLWYLIKWLERSTFKIRL